jgi:hypothetical protein
VQKAKGMALDQIEMDGNFPFIGAKTRIAGKIPSALWKEKNNSASL